MKGFVYLLCDGENFKIGVTKHKDINKRIKELQTGNPNEIFISAYHQTNYPYKIEKMMHFKYGLSKIQNEWFNLSIEQVINFNEECKKCEEVIKCLKDNPFF